MKIIKNFKRCILFLISLIAVFLNEPQTCTAQNILSPSSAEDVAIVFYKTAGVKPNFKEWEKKKDEFKTKSLTETQNYIEKENQRFLKKWVEFDKTDSIININFSAKAIIKPLPLENSKEKPTYNFYILTPNAQKTYFPYIFQDTSFSVIAQDFEQFLSHKIEETQSFLILKNIDLNKEEPVEVFISIQPQKAYTDKPEHIDGIDQWILMGRITSMRVVATKSSETLLYYGAPWYTSPAGKELKTIYDKRLEDNKNTINSGL